MVIERTQKNKLTITVSSSIDSYGLQRLIDYVKYIEATSQSKASRCRCTSRRGECLLVG
jgi:hypothetical protein